MPTTAISPTAIGISTSAGEAPTGVVPSPPGAGVAVGTDVAGVDGRDVGALVGAEMGVDVGVDVGVGVGGTDAVSATEKVSLPRVMWPSVAAAVQRIS